MLRPLSALLVLLLAGCASTQQDDEPVTPGLTPTMQQQELAALESRVQDLQKSMTEMLERLDIINQRMNGLERAAVHVSPAPPATREEGRPSATRAVPVPAVAAPATVSSAVVSKPIASAQLAELYRTGLMLYGQGKFADARRTFTQVFETDRSGELADNALYWIGETYFVTGAFTEAMKHYRRVTTEYGESNKAPDALFKTGVAYGKTGDLGVARTTLEEVIRRYPYSSPAAAAKLELERIRY